MRWGANKRGITAKACPRKPLRRLSDVAQYPYNHCDDEGEDDYPNEVAEHCVAYLCETAERHAEEVPEEEHRFLDYHPKHWHEEDE